MLKTDVVVIGAGAVGCAVARYAVIISNIRGTGIDIAAPKLWGLK